MIVEGHIQVMSSSDGYFISVHFHQEGEYFYFIVFNGQIDRYTVYYIPLLVLEHKRLGYFSKSFTVQQHHVFPMQIAG